MNNNEEKETLQVKNINLRDIVGWAINGLCAICCTFALLIFQDIQAEFRTVKDNIEKLDSRLSNMESLNSIRAERITKLEGDVSTVRALGAIVENRLIRIEDKLDGYLSIKGRR